MVIGTLVLRLQVPEAGSLKEKAPGGPLPGRPGPPQTFDVAIAKVGDQDLWQAVQLGVACVSNDAGHADEVCQKVLGFVAADGEAPCSTDSRFSNPAPVNEALGPVRRLTLSDRRAAGCWPRPSWVPGWPSYDSTTVTVALRAIGRALGGHFSTLQWVLEGVPDHPRRAGPARRRHRPGRRPRPHLPHRGGRVRGDLGPLRGGGERGLPGARPAAPGGGTASLLVPAPSPSSRRASRRAIGDGRSGPGRASPVWRRRRPAPRGLPGRPRKLALGVLINVPLAGGHRSRRRSPSSNRSPLQQNRPPRRAFYCRIRIPESCAGLRVTDHASPNQQGMQPPKSGSAALSCGKAPPSRAPSPIQ